MQHSQPTPTPTPSPTPGRPPTGFSGVAVATDRDRLWSTGDYFFKVVSAVEKPAKRSGNPMVELQLEVYSESGARRRVYDYLTASTAWKTGPLCDALGLRDKYDFDSLSPEDLVGRTGRLRLDTRPPKDGYPAKNVVAAYHSSAPSRDGPVEA